MTSEEWEIIRFTLGVSAFSTLAILPFGLATAWILARYQWRGKSLVETLIALPLIMPPVATGLILLKLLGRKGMIGGSLYKLFDFEIVFTWRAVVIAIGIMSFPLLVRGARVAFEGVNPRLEQMARTLGASEIRVFFSITLPLALRGVLAGMILAFARALGEFGATVLVAGNIPGKTSTISLTIYNLVQLGQDHAAFKMLVFSIIIAFGAVWFSELMVVGAQRNSK